MTTSQDTLTADHWWWRPGWAQGRRFLTWHLTFDGQHQVHKLAAAYRAALGTVPGWDLVPDQWLHLTMQGVGFTDEVDESELRAIILEARRRLREVEPFELDLRRPVFTPEAIRWDPDSAGPAAVRGAIRDGIAARLGDVPEPAQGFTAHVTIAYSNAVRPARAALDAIASVPELSATARITHAELIVLDRDNRMYEWETYERVALREN